MILKLVYWFYDPRTEQQCFKMASSLQYNCNTTVAMLNLANHYRMWELFISFLKPQTEIIYVLYCRRGREKVNFFERTDGQLLL